MRCHVTQPDHKLVLERVARRDDDNVALAIEPLGAKAWCVSVGCVQYREIELARLEAAAEIHQIAFVHPKLHAGMLGLE